MSLAPKVNWQKPDLVPEVPKYDYDLFWIAVQYQRSENEKPKTSVFLAHYMNKPLDLDENGESIDPNPHEDDDGDPIHSVGWHSQYDHPDYNGYYQPIDFGDQVKLLGWAEYVPPVFEGSEGTEQCAT